MTKWYSYLDDSTTQGAEVLTSAIENNVGIGSDINGVQISVVGDKLTFTVSGVGSTTLTLSQIQVIVYEYGECMDGRRIFNEVCGRPT